MYTASVAQLKSELKAMPQKDILELCLKLIKYKKENKELVSYLVFECGDEKTYITNLKSDMDEMFNEVNTNTFYWAKKTIRKILRFVSKHGKYSGLPQTNIELLIHFCNSMRELPFNIEESMVMLNLYKAQLKKIDKFILSLHEDLQFDYQEIIQDLKL